jgi:DNA primase
MTSRRLSPQLTSQPELSSIVAGGSDFDVKERVRQATDIVDLLGSYMQIRRQGSNFVAHCPWHDDRRPSLQINPARQSWVCWVCNFRGDIFDFVMRREGVEFYDALRMLADRLGIEVKPTGPAPVKGSADDKQTLFRAMAWAAEMFQAELADSDTARLAREYIANRQLTSDTVSRFRIGFSPLDRDWLAHRARSSEFSPQVLEACGLLLRRENTSNYLDRFRGRLMFPIQDTLGRVIAFGGRVVPGLYGEGEEPPGKYINSPETKLFSKSENLYALNLATDSVSKSRHLIVMEGYTDVIAAYQSGMRGVVAALGTAVNQRHIKLMKRYADRITLVLDGDAAGQRRTNEILDLFVAENVDLRILTLPEGLDPFDFVQSQGSEPLLKLIDNAPDAMEHRIRVETSGVDLLNDTHRSTQALDRILQTIAQIPQSLTATAAATKLRIDQLLARLSRTFRMEKSTLLERLQDLQSKVVRTNDAPAASESVNWKLQDFDSAEVELIRLLLLDHSLLDLAVEGVSADDFRLGPLREIYLRICDGFQEGLDVSFEGLMVHFEDPQIRGLLILLNEEAVTRHEVAVEDCRQRLEAVLDVFRRRHDHKDAQNMLGKLEEPNLDPKEEAETLEALLRKARQRHGISAPMDG